MATAAWLAAHPKLTLYPPKAIAEQIQEYGKAMGLKPSKAGVALWVKALELVMPPAKRPLSPAVVLSPPALTTPGIPEMREESPAFRDRMAALETQVRDLQSRITALPLKAAKEIGEESRALMERMAALETQVQALQARISAALSPKAAQENSSPRTKNSAISVPEAEQIELWAELDGWEENSPISERLEEPRLAAEPWPSVEADQVVACLPAAPVPCGVMPAGRRRPRREVSSRSYLQLSTSDERQRLISLVSEFTALGFKEPKTADEVVRFLQARGDGIEALYDLVMMRRIRMAMFEPHSDALTGDLEPGISTRKPELQPKQPADVTVRHAVAQRSPSEEISQKPVERSQRPPSLEPEQLTQPTQRELPPQQKSSHEESTPNLALSPNQSAAVTDEPTEIVDLRSGKTLRELAGRSQRPPSSEPEQRPYPTRRELPPQPRSSHEGAAPPLELPPNPPTAASNGSAVVSDPSHQEILKEQPERSQTPHPEPKQRSQPIPRKSPPQQQSSSSKHVAAAQLPKQKKKKKGFWGLF